MCHLSCMKKSPIPWWGFMIGFVLSQGVFLSVIFHNVLSEFWIWQLLTWLKARADTWEEVILLVLCYETDDMHTVFQESVNHSMVSAIHIHFNLSLLVFRFHFAVLGKVSKNLNSWNGETRKTEPFCYAWLSVTQLTFLCTLVSSNQYKLI